MVQLVELIYKEDVMAGIKFEGRSRLELKVEMVLEEAGFDFTTEYIYPDLVASSGRPLRFDFAVFDEDGNVDFLVECQGSQHYQVKNGNYAKLKAQKYNDTQKRMYCYKHNIPLVFVDFHEIHSITLEEIMKRAGL